MERVNEPGYLALTENDRSKSEQPSIYANLICDRSGMSPSPSQWRKVCGYMQLYLRGGPEGDTLAERIDQIISPSRSWPKDLAYRGLRRYAEWRTFLKWKFVFQMHNSPGIDSILYQSNDRSV